MARLRHDARLGAALAVVLGALALAPALGAAPGAPQSATSALEQGVLAQINTFRVAHRLAPLRLSAALSAAARQHADEMAGDGYFGHDSADGSPFWKRIQSYYPSGTYGYWSVGENLLWSSPDVDAVGALRLWVGSPEHLANLLKPGWREIGVAAVHAAGAPGVYRGLDVTIVATDFGVRR